MIDRTQTDWYRDAIIYQVHIKSFFDANDDGVGDIRGLIRKLDYISDLGVNAIWLMPFYPSPLRDDGYDISDYRGINKTYGTMASFRTLIKEAHKRDLRVITELVINHTSDQHPWFQRARKAAPGTPQRDFYVWSDTDEKYADTRIIFLDTEGSNWTYDSVAKAYYWHRFYSHQPDLNFDNPKVLEAVIELMFHWLDMGVDGLRLDAIPYLIERDGTSCENLPETHAVIKDIRAALDQRYPDRMLLAEANQWPEDTAPYFGDGDECHMAFHFPLMPRMYMSIAQEDRHPVSDILRQTPEIPEGSQWAIFLRNHDELTLEMVTDRERDYLWSFYAADRRARINLGIRRRLAPLLENDRRKIELMNSLLLTMPGTPILYYGDEIGMGDNIYLGDRDGVRTPMQWSSDRNGGFSRADPAQLFLPAIQDPIYGHQAVNVEAQQRSPSSLLSWTKRMLALRRSFRAFGRGSLRFLFPTNRKVLSYLREFDGERILCIANISRSPQAVELDLAEHAGLTPVEMTGGEAFPPIGELPYLLTLPAYGFYWFTLASLPVEPDRLGPQIQPELFTLVRTGGLDNLLTGRERAAFETTVTPRYLAAQRWFAGKTHRIARTHLDQLAILPTRSGKGDGFLLSEVAVELKSGQRQNYFIPMALSSSEEESLLPYALARVRRGSKAGLLFGASEEPEFALAMVEAMRDGRMLPMSGGATLKFSATKSFPAHLEVVAERVNRIGGDQSNTSIGIDSTMVLKAYRHLQTGVHPEVEMGRYLTEVAGFANTPPVFGMLEKIDDAGSSTAFAVLQGFVVNQGDAATVAIAGLAHDLDMRMILADGEAPLAQPESRFLHYATMIGRRTGELHTALARPTENVDFAPERLSAADMAAQLNSALSYAENAFSALAALSTRTDIEEELIGRKKECISQLRKLAKVPRGAVKTRVHGDYHLGQVLVVEDDVIIVDFEGEPGQVANARRAKDHPLRDVAGMLRSFAYAAATATRSLGERFPEIGPETLNIAQAWREHCERSFLLAYTEATKDSRAWVGAEAGRSRMLSFQLLKRALYEIVYEANNRPDWIDLPCTGVIEILNDLARA